MPHIAGCSTPGTVTLLTTPPSVRAAECLTTIPMVSGAVLVTVSLISRRRAVTSLVVLILGGGGSIWITRTKVKLVAVAVTTHLQWASERYQRCDAPAPPDILEHRIIGHAAQGLPGPQSLNHMDSELAPCGPRTSGSDSDALVKQKEFQRLQRKLHRKCLRTVPAPS